MEKGKEITLANFIDDNYRLISALGVFVALSIYAKTTNSFYGNALSGVFLIQSILIWYELYKKVPLDTKAFSSISFFESLLIAPLTYLIVDLGMKNILLGAGLFLSVILIYTILIGIRIFKNKKSNKQEDTSN